MARPRTPTPLLELRGAFKHDPQRRRARGPEPDAGGALGEPPVNLPEELASIWRELETLAPAGVLANADRWLVEIACKLMWRFRSASETLTAAELNLLVSCLSRMGMTPSDRSKVGVQTAKESTGARDDLADLAAEARTLLRLPN